MSRYVGELRGAIKKITPVLEKMSDEATRRRPGPGKWSPREIIGHLIDSAFNTADYAAHLEHHLRQIVKPN